MKKHSPRESVQLPLRVFMYTLDQISEVLQVPLGTIKGGYIYFQGRSQGRARIDLMRARNIAPPESKPDWRVAETELIRWMRYKGFTFSKRKNVES